MKFNKFYKGYKKAVKNNPDSPFLIHFRIRTHGKTDIQNCHPFRINEDQAFIHNGVIQKVQADPDKVKNDTQMFNELFLQDLPEAWEKSKATLALIEEYIGLSKLCILNIDGEVDILNESLGNWTEDGVWWSNYSYLDNTKYYKLTGKPIVQSYYRGRAKDGKYSGYSRKTFSNVQEDFRKSEREKLKDDIRDAKERLLDKEIASGGTIPKHPHKTLQELEGDAWLEQANREEDTGSFTECQICNQHEASYLTTTIMMDGIYYEACRDCLSTIDDSGRVYYEHNIKTLVEVYSDIYPDREEGDEDTFHDPGCMGTDENDIPFHLNN